MKLKNLVIVFFLLILVTASNAKVDNKKSLTLEGAMKVIAAAVDYAKKNNAPGAAIAVVDDGGNLIALERLDGTFAAGPNISIGKARTAALFKKPTKVFEDIIAKGRTSMVALQDFTPLQGGVPIMLGGEIVGAIGVSGAASAQQDEEVAVAGATALTASSASMTTAPSQKVTYFEKGKGSGAFSKGVPLLEIANYKIHASRRTEPGMAEVHVKDADIIYVLEGSATFITGGMVVDGKTTAQDEIRGKEKSGGDTYNITKGDVIIVPAGTPHWFKAVQGPLLYYVVKVS